jgi:hypothetical protein
VALWSLVAAGRIPDDDPDAAGVLRKQLAAILSDPRWQCGLSSFHADTTPPVRVVLHLPEDDALAAACA